MRVLVSVKNWSEGTLRDLRDIPSVWGVILGHPFCRQLGAPGGWLDLVRFTKEAKTLGHRVALQLPVYLTSRNAYDWKSLISLLEEEKVLDYVFLSDIGILRALDSERVAVFVWDKFGFGRSLFPNSAYLTLLAKLGIRGIELLDFAHCKNVKQNDLEPFVYGFGPTIVSFARICYQSYFQKQECGDRQFCKLPIPVESESLKLSLVADGHTLLARKRHDLFNNSGKREADDKMIFTLCAEGISDLTEVLERLNEDKRDSSSTAVAGKDIE